MGADELESLDHEGIDDGFPGANEIEIDDEIPHGPAALVQAAEELDVAYHEGFARQVRVGVDVEPILSQQALLDELAQQEEMAGTIMGKEAVEDEKFVDAPDKALDVPRSYRFVQLLDDRLEMSALEGSFGFTENGQAGVPVEEAFAGGELGLTPGPRSAPKGSSLLRSFR